MGTAISDNMLGARLDIESGRNYILLRPTEGQLARQKLNKSSFTLYLNQRNSDGPVVEGNDSNQNTTDGASKQLKADGMEKVED